MTGIDTKIGKLPPQVDLAAAYKTLSEVSQYNPQMGHIFSGATLGVDAKTGIDGKYVMKASIPAGRYYVYAVTVNDVFAVEWLVPFNVSSSGEMTIDLDNDNALSISNFGA